MQNQVAESRIEIEQARLLTMKAAWLMDTVGAKGARFEIAAIKVVAARMAHEPSSTARSSCSARPASPTTGRSREMWTYARTIRLADGPDEVHLMQIARRELRKYEASA